MMIIVRVLIFFEVKLNRGEIVHSRMTGDKQVRYSALPALFFYEFFIKKGTYRFGDYSIDVNSRGVHTLKKIRSGAGITQIVDERFSDLSKEFAHSQLLISLQASLLGMAS